MPVFSAPDFADHEQVVFASDPETGLRAIIAIHSTRLGPSLGGCRMWPYETEQAAITDALRLSRGMSYKSSLAGLPLGGGKSVIIGNSRQQKTPELLAAMARAVDRLNGRYIIAEDVGTTVEDMIELRRGTAHVTGLPVEMGGSGDPSPATAYGVYLGIKAGVAHRFRANSLSGLTVAVQGLGNVGWHLTERLVRDGAKVLAADLRPDVLAKAMAQFGVEPVAPDAIHAAHADVYAPCALGATLNDATIPQITAKIVAGSANNQLAEARHGAMLAERGILYAPDYAINAGGIINIAYERDGQYDQAKAFAHVEKIYGTLSDIFHMADREGIATNQAADRLAEQRLAA